MAHYFINRPIFAWVIAIAIMLFGCFAISNPPIEDYPQLAPPQVTINGNYPGASAKAIESSVTQVIEQNLTGIDHLIYMSSSSNSSGSFSLTLSFENGTDPDTAQVQVQNKLDQVVSKMPSSVMDQGIYVAKSSTMRLMIIGLATTDDNMSMAQLGDYLQDYLKDPISRIQGVGNVEIWSPEIAMRIWLDPQKLNRYTLTPQNIVSAIQQQNNALRLGTLGQEPTLKGQLITTQVVGHDLLQHVEEFKHILVKANNSGGKVFLKDVARVELGSSSYGIDIRNQGDRTAGMAIYLSPGENALATADAIKSKLQEIEANLPSSLTFSIVGDKSPFIKESIKEVIFTLFIAILLVVIIMYLFLQSVKATLIPAITVPVVLLGTFGMLICMGYTINLLTMLALVLAIGLLVDDAIVVVENVERLMEEEQLSAREAAHKSMRQISGTLVGIAVVLSAVFIPMAFLESTLGSIYRQFTVAIVSSMILSVIVAMILTPALCATILKQHKTQQKPRFLRLFNAALGHLTDYYVLLVSKSFKHKIVYLIVYGVLLCGTVFLWFGIPTSFIPEEDKGMVSVFVQLPSGATLERTNAVLRDIEKYFWSNEAKNIRQVFSVAGTSESNTGGVYVDLIDWDQRTDSTQSVKAITERASIALSKIKSAQIYPYMLPAIDGLGDSDGFEAYLIDYRGQGYEALLNARNQLIALASQQPGLERVRPDGDFGESPRLQLDINYEKAMVLGVDETNIDNMLSFAIGANYVGDFIYNGRIKEVKVQADAQYRVKPDNLRLWHISNKDGEMIPFDAFAGFHWSHGVPSLTRFNGYPAVKIKGGIAHGFSSGEGMKTIEQLIKHLPAGFGIEWSGSSYIEKQSSQNMGVLYGISTLVVFLALAALYESWSIPLSVILVVPLGILGAVAITTFNGLSNNVYFQVGILTTIGLTAKNAILIVEFAKLRYEQGVELVNATIEACRLRFRPILMTSLAFIFGALPLILHTGAGAASRHSIGWVVLGGMASATVLSIIFAPLFFVLVMSLFRVQRKGTAVLHIEREIENAK